MYDNKLDASITNFEGIFGLGLPYKSRSAGEQSWLTTASWCLIGSAKLLVTSWWFHSNRSLQGNMYIILVLTVILEGATHPMYALLF